MFQLFKERNFNDYLNDTFSFFRILGKHYFKNYFVINGGLLLIASVMIYFFSQIYFDFIFSSLRNGENPNDSFGNYFQNNIGLGITLLILACIFLMFISLLQFAYPVIYLDLYDSHKGTNFTTKNILIALKAKSFKMIKFIIGSIFIIFPITAIIVSLNVLLCFIIIGIPLLLLTLPSVLCWVHLSFYYYMNSDESFFRAIGDGFDTVKDQFFPIIGSAFVMYIIIQTVTTIFTLIPYFIGIASIFTSRQDYNSNGEDPFSTVTIILSITMVVSIIVSYILNNLLLINQGMIYYSHVENEESNYTKNAIDLIGTDSE